MTKTKVQIVWFKRDLRITDHMALQGAAHAGAVLPLYIVEPKYWDGPDTSARQWNFIRDSLLELSASLSSLGQPLITRTGDVIDILTKLQGQIIIDAIWSHEETGNYWTFSRDRKLAAWCRSHSIPWIEFPQNGVVRGLPDRNGWARHWDNFMARKQSAAPLSLTPILKIEADPLPDAHQLNLDSDPCSQRQLGGRRIGVESLTSFLNERGSHYRYHMSSPVTAATSCSRLSPHIAYGTLSLREIVHTMEKRRSSIRSSSTDLHKIWRHSLSSFNSRLHWHCHFMQKLENQVDIEWKNMHSAYDQIRDNNHAHLQAWIKGETGWPFVDACMRMLQATGWINFRMRAMLMAVASYHLWIHWREPGEHLARLFTDYEPGIHWSQVQMQSGTTGINLPRIYNPIKQGYEQDPSGIFVRHWVPELRIVPDEYVHEPWNWRDAPTSFVNCYPQPIVEHIQAAKLARQKIWGVRKDGAFKETADSIQAKHGSRKSKGHKFSQKAPRQRVQKTQSRFHDKQLTLFESLQAQKTRNREHKN